MDKRRAMVTIVTGLPGSGKTTYCKGLINDHTVVYDLDAITAALSYGKGYACARTLANSLINIVMDTADILGTDLLLIRTSPTAAEHSNWMRRGAAFIEIQRPVIECRGCRDGFTDEEWAIVMQKHEAYLNMCQPKIIPAERW